MRNHLLTTGLLVAVLASGSFFALPAEAKKPKLAAETTVWEPSKVSEPSGSVSVSEPSGKAPEIDPSMGRAGMIVLVGGLMMLVDRYRRR